MWRRIFRYIATPVIVVVTAISGASTESNNTGDAPSTSSSSQNSSSGSSSGNNGSNSSPNQSSSSTLTSHENNQQQAQNVVSFNVFAQNMRLLDPHVSDSLWAFPLNHLMHKRVRNTHEDNLERSYMMAKQALNEQTPPQNRLDTFDIVSIQEVFEEEAREDILSHIPNGFNTSVRDQYIVNLGGHDHWYDPREDDGLMLLVDKNHHVSHHTFVKWEESVRPDSMAKKGFTVTRVRFGNDPDHYITVINLHAQADHESLHQNRETRVHQMRQLGDYINTYLPATHPVLFTGDYNVDGGTDEYADMLSNLDLPSDADFWKSEYPTLPGYTWDTDRNFYAWFLSQDQDNNIAPEMRFQRLDYFMVKQGSQFNIELDSIEIVDDARVSDLWTEWRNSNGDRTGYLSDHYGLKGSFRLVDMR